MTNKFTTHAKQTIMNYSQNNEQEIILNYFAGKTGRLLDIGANDGKTFSNSYALIEQGWGGILVEPLPSCVKKLKKLHGENNKVTIIDAAIVSVPTDEKIKFYVNDPHIPNDDGLLSTAVVSEKDRWKGLNFNEIEVDAYTYTDLFDGEKFDFISIDAEGMDYAILRQIDLTKTECKLLCVEFNGVNPQVYLDYCVKHGMQEIHRNNENLIFAK